MRTNRDSHPITPGSDASRYAIILKEEFLLPMQLTQKQLAKAIHVSYQRINEMINCKRGISPSLSLRLAKYFGTSPDFWMNLQLRWELYHAQQKEKRAIEKHPAT